MIRSEICVVGAGPSGSTISSQLAAAGRHVILLDAAQLPRAHVGESLPPTILPLLDYLGISTAVETARFLRSQRAIVFWGKTPQETKPESESPGFQVDRGAFDSILVEMARRQGVRIMQSTQATNIIRNDQGSWDVSVRTNGCIETIRCNFVVDAAGRTGACAPRQRTNLSCSTMAIYGYWEDLPNCGTETRIEAGSDRWYWGAPLPDNQFNATVFVDPRSLRSALNLNCFYRALLAESVLLGMCLQGELIAGPKVCVTTPSIADEVVGDGWIKCGEAAFTIDPLSSQGVQLAIANAIQAAAVVSTSLDDPGENAEIARQFYRERVRSSAIRNADFAREIYRDHAEVCSNEFWTTRSEPQVDEAGVKIDHQDESPGHPSTLLPSRDESPQWDSDILVLSPSASVVQAPIVDGLRIRFSAAVIPPRGKEPVAFIGNVPMSYILGTLGSRPKAQSFLSDLQARFGHRSGRLAFKWLVTSGLVLLHGEMGSDTME